MKKLVYSIIAVSLALASCHKDENIGGTAVQNMSGEFWVKLDDGNGEFGDSYYTIATYNTASNKADSMYVDDYANASTGVPFWEIKGKVATNVANGTFSAANIVNEDYDSHFTITDGKIMHNAATAPGSHLKTDSIYFKIQFDDEDPATVHTVSGYARTKWDEDDHY